MSKAKTGLFALGVAAGFALGAGGCGNSASSCDPTTCNGCCFSGMCLSGNLPTACGAQGAACLTCGAGQYCAGGVCAAPGSNDSGTDSGTGGQDSGSPDAGPTDSGNPGTDSGTGNDAGSNPNCVGPVPLVYQASLDRSPHQVTAPAVPDAGSLYLDPSYGTRVLRLTDVNASQTPDASYRVANEFWGNDWNTDATLFYIQSSSSGLLAYAFDPVTMSATRVMDKTQPTKALALPFGASGGFSRLDPNILYGIKGLSIAQFDFSTQTQTILFDVHTLVPDAGGYSLGVEQGSNGLMATSFGGPQQDKMPFLATWDPATGTHHLLDVLTSTLDGVALGVTIGGTGVHTFKIDKSGQYLSFNAAGATPTTWIWNTATNTVQSVNGTGTIGWGAYVGKTGSDAYDWQEKPLGGTTATPLVAPLLSPADTLASSSLDWVNAVPGALAPVIAETMRQPADTGPWRAWDDELLAVDTTGQTYPVDGGSPQTRVWRFAHTFNTYSGTIYSDNFYYLFIPRVSQNGWFAIWDTNWGQTLGTDSTGNPRTDVFIAELKNPCGP